MLLEAPPPETRTLLKLRLSSVARCPGGHRSVVDVVSVRLPVTLPFLSDVNSPDFVVVPWVTVFLGSEGTLPPLLTHESVLVKSALAVIVTVWLFQGHSRVPGDTVSLRRKRVGNGFVRKCA